MTTPIAAAGPDASPSVVYGYEPTHHPQLAVCLCWCGARSVGYTSYYYRDRLVAIRDHCPDHLPTTGAAYTLQAG